jgi:hypothetical protein
MNGPAKYIFTGFVFLMIFQHYFSQSVYGIITGGYHHVIPSKQLPSYIVNTYFQVTDPWFWREENLSLERFATIETSLGYRLNDDLSIEVLGSYIRGLRSVNHETTNNWRYKSEFSGNAFRISPKVSMNVFSKFRTQLYVKLGGVFDWAKFYYHQTVFNDGLDYLSIKEGSVSYCYSKSLSFGLSADIGVRIKLTDRVSIVGELSFVRQSHSPAKGELIKYTIDGNSKLAGFSEIPYYSQIEFSDRSEWFYCTSSDKGKPQKLYQREYSLNSVGLKVGLEFVIWKCRVVSR